MIAYRCSVTHGTREPTVYHSKISCDQIPDGWFATKEEAIEAVTDELDRYAASCERAAWFCVNNRDPMNSRFD